MFFRDVIGQEEIKQRLIQEVSEGRIPHAQLICGPEGVGKMPLAIAYARYISCTNRGETDACGVDEKLSSNVRSLPSPSSALIEPLSSLRPLFLSFV